MGYKILMALNGLDIGGAETHTVELSLELHRRGYEVILASNGGTYVSKLEEAGLRHYQVPLNRRKAGAMRTSQKMLEQIIREEKPDIVHAHARIPAYLIGRLQKKLKFAFVTTDHAVFQSSFLADRMTDWGDYTVAVSQDTKNYLMEKFGVPEDHILVTINGIDTNRFSPETSAEPIAAELGLNLNRPVLGTVSRLDPTSSKAATLLLENAPALAEKIPGLQFVIVGGGGEFEKLKELAARQNEAAGAPYIHMTGPRTDVDQILAVCDCFVGVGRSALEAMATEKPVILAGNRGYQGILTPDNLEDASSRNFGCRNAQPLEGEPLCRDVVSLLQMSGEEKQKLGSFGRSVVLERYSVSRMVDDYEKVYRQVL